MEKATDLIFDFRKGIYKIEGSVVPVVEAHLKQGNIDQAIRIYDKCQAEVLSSVSESTQIIKEKIFNYLVEQGEYARAWDFRGDSDDISKIVSAMCEKNKKADAIKFVNTRLTNYGNDILAKQEALKIINQY
ncbi:MAG: hypothetical protein MJZ71_01045 [Bacteroidales bacterium]|nr:hypothetical protein [Bacteroidales bacterium]